MPPHTNIWCVCVCVCACLLCDLCFLVNAERAMHNHKAIPSATLYFLIYFPIIKSPAVVF